MDWPKTLRRLDALIRTGDISAAHSELQTLTGVKVPREHAASVAYMSGRAGIPSLGTRILYPIVRPSARKQSIAATDSEIAEYAACLTKIGASEEAYELLSKADSGKAPVVLLYRAFALAARWEYRETIPLLQEYLRHISLHSYQALVGMANLAAALVYERDHRKATPILQELIHESSVRRLRLLMGIALELTAANFVLQLEFESALTFLNEAENKLTHKDGLDNFFIRKWKTIAKLLVTKEEDASISAIRAEAIQRNHWETLRDLDRYKMIATQDQNLLARLYYGTPYPSFKARLLKDYGRNVSAPTEYLWHLGPEGEPQAAIDVAAGQLVGSRERLKRGHLIDRVLTALASDVYRPQRLAVLHQRLFPGEHFNPSSSPHRIHEAIRRFRAWTKDLRLRLEVQESDGSYRLHAPVPMTLRLAPASSEAMMKYSTPLEALRVALGSESFSLNAAAQALDVSARSALRVLTEGISNGLLSRSGNGKATSYSFTVSDHVAPEKRRA